MRIKTLNQTISFIVVLATLLMLVGCSQPQKKPDPSPIAPEAQGGMMGQNSPSSMMYNTPDVMQNAMSAPENRQAMINMMSSAQMRPVMVDMMKDPSMRQAMIDIMADPAMKDTFATMVRDPRLAPIAREALK